MVIVGMLGALRGGLVPGVQTAFLWLLVVCAILWAIVTKLWELGGLHRTALKAMSEALQAPLGVCCAAP